MEGQDVNNLRAGVGSALAFRKCMQVAHSNINKRIFQEQDMRRDTKIAKSRKVVGAGGGRASSD